MSHTTYSGAHALGTLTLTVLYYFLEDSVLTSIATCISVFDSLVCQLVPKVHNSPPWLTFVKTIGDTLQRVVFCSK